MKPLDVNLGQYNDVVELYHNESDRAAAILAGSFVEHHLAVLLKAFLIEDSEVDDLFHGFGPLSTFAQRISMAAAIGIIDKENRDELRAIKEIRNHFAHHPLQASFADQLLDKHFNRLSATHDPAFNVHGDGPLQDRKLVSVVPNSAVVKRMS
jgi:DNA-binding MltR family transcriptional regulator